MRNLILILGILLSTFSYSQDTGDKISKEQNDEIHIYTLLKIKERADDLCRENAIIFFNTELSPEVRIEKSEMIQDKIEMSVVNYNFYSKYHKVSKVLLEKYSLKTEYHLKDFYCIGE